MLATWNVLTLLDNNRQLERCTAGVARKLGRYNINIAALSETQLAGKSTCEEAGAGYTFSCKGRSENKYGQAAVGFANKTNLTEFVKSPPQGVSDRVMTLRLNLSSGHFCTIISAYAQTMTASDEDKEQFYETLSNTLQSIPFNDKLIVLGDFNARVGRGDNYFWNEVMGRP